VASGLGHRPRKRRASFLCLMHKPMKQGCAIAAFFCTLRRQPPFGPLRSLAPANARRIPTGRKQETNLLILLNARPTEKPPHLLGLDQAVLTGLVSTCRDTCAAGAHAPADLVRAGAGNLLPPFASRSMAEEQETGTARPPPCRRSP